MPEAQLMARAAAPFTQIVRTIQPDHLGGRTPCAEFDVRMLVNHLLFWGPSLEGAARKESVLPPAAAEADVDLTEGGWASALDAQADRTAAAWSKTDAWDGLTRMAGPMELPASLIGAMVLGEFVVHGWDLAQATGQQLAWGEDLLMYLLDATEKNAAPGREMGVYGPEVVVPAAASTLDRILGLTGRDPRWTP